MTPIEPANGRPFSMTMNRASLELARDTELTITDWRIMTTISAIADREGQAFVEAAEIAAYLGISRNVTSTSLKRLDRKGIITKVKNGHYRVPERIVRSVAEAERSRKLLREARKRQAEARAAAPRLRVVI